MVAGKLQSSGVVVAYTQTGMYSPTPVVTAT